MSIEQRDRLFREIEGALNLKLISYLTSDRQGGMEAQIASDVVPRFRRHLEAIGEVEQIGLFIYSRGGDTNVPWRLVTYIKEYCKKFIVLVPFRAHSAATLICMGADKIFMGKMGELSSVDPSVANPFNPADPSNPLARIPISVEDVNSYKDLAKRFGIPDDKPELNAQIFMTLASKVEPLALGNVERHHRQIRKLGEDLLALHWEDNHENRERQKKVVKMMTEELFSHAHLINRQEAKKIGLDVELASKSHDALMWELYSQYAQEMELDRPFLPQQVLGSQNSTTIEIKRSFLESLGQTDAFVSSGIVSRIAPAPMQLPPGIQLQGLQAQVQFAVQMQSDSWKIIR